MNGLHFLGSRRKASSRNGLRRCSLSKVKKFVPHVPRAQTHTLVKRLVSFRSERKGRKRNPAYVLTCPTGNGELGNIASNPGSNAGLAVPALLRIEHWAGNTYASEPSSASGIGTLLRSMTMSRRVPSFTRTCLAKRRLPSETLGSPRSR